MIPSNIVVCLVACCIFASEAAVAKKNDSKFNFPKNLVGLNDTAFQWLQPYSRIHGIADFGQDKFDGDAPVHIRKALAEATLSDDPLANQYSAPDGIPRLQRAIAKLYSPLIGHELNPDEEVIVTVGGTEAIHVAVLGHTNPGDEWVVIEPAYIKYIPSIKMAWGVPRYSPLKLVENNGTIDGDDWVIDREQMESLFTEKTKGIIINNPLNPLGKVYKLEELEFIASLAKKYDTLVISDEAHEWITFKPHIRIASLPGMFERTITIGTASKTFSLTGFRIGWVYGPTRMLDHVRTVHLETVNCPPTPQQYAIAYALEQEYHDMRTAKSFFAAHARTVRTERDMMTEALANAGIKPIVADAGFCMLGDWSSLRKKLPEGTRTGMDFILWMVEKIGVLAWPLSMFYGDEHKYMSEDYVRFCFHKNVSTIEEGARRFAKINSIL